MRRAWPLLTLLCLALLPLGTAQASFVYFDPSLNGVTLRVATPVFSLQAQPDPGSSLACSLEFQGQQVQMPYDDQQQGCVYQWPTPLAPGSYTATITVSSPGVSPLVENLQFSVDQGAVASLPQENLASIEAQRVLDYVRHAVGLPDTGFDAGLQAASQAHAQYFVRNQTLYTASVSMHTEPAAQAPGFTGSLPQDRDNAFSAIAGGSEVMVSGDPSGPYSLQGLFDTTFHRFGLLDPTLTALGAGYDQSPLGDASGQAAYVVDLDTGFDPAAQMSWEFPWNGATGVPVAFLGEDPDPLAGIAPAAQTQSQPESGYPASLSFDPGQVQSVTVAQATLTRDGVAVPSYLVDSATYHDQNATYPDESMGTSVALFPAQPLQYETTYTASMSGTITLASGGTQPFQDSWSFTTGAAPSVSGAYEDGGTLYVVGQNLEFAYISTYWYLGGNPTLGNTSYQGAHLISAPVSGNLTKVEVTDGATGRVIGDIPVAKAPFSDAGASSASQYYVDADQAAGLVQGYPDGTFRPDAAVTGAQAIVMLYRAMGSPSTAGEAQVAGVPSWAEAAVQWADAASVVEPGDGFLPYADATRAQLTTWLWRAFGLPPAQTAPAFSDASTIPAAFQGYVSAAAQDGVVLGYPDGTFRPDAPVQRGAFAIWTWRLHAALIAPQSLF
jgi:hypothetical protein